MEAAAGQRLASQDAHHHDAMQKLREEHAEQAQRSRRQAEEEHQRELEHERRDYEARIAGMVRQSSSLESDFLQVCVMRMSRCSLALIL